MSRVAMRKWLDNGMAEAPAPTRSELASYLLVNEEYLEEDQDSDRYTRWITAAYRLALLTRSGAS